MTDNKKNVKYPGTRITTNGNTLVATYTEARMVEGGIFYPITPSTEQGELFEMSFAKGELNVFGKAKIAVEAEGEHAAQGGAIAYSVAGKRTVNFTSGQGIVYGLEQYYHAPGKFSTMVIEVAARALTKTSLNVHCGHDDIAAALDTGWIMLMAKEAQQAADQALIIRRVAELSLTPGMNIQDGFLTSHLERTYLKLEADLIREFVGRPEDIIKTPTPAQVELFGPTRRRIPEMYDLKSPLMLGTVQNQEHYMNGIVARRDNFIEPILGFLEQAYKDFAELTGREYGFISEYNTENADTVFIALGCAAENIEAGVDHIKKRDGVDVGVIHINVIRPFPEAAVANALKGKKNIIVLERVDDQTAGDAPLCRDIRTALMKAAENAQSNCHKDMPTITPEEMPRVFAGIYGLGSRDFRPEHTIGAYEYVEKERKRQDGESAAEGQHFFYLGVNHPYAVESDDKPSLLPSDSIAVRFHSIGGWGMITTGKNLSEVLGELGDYVSERDHPGENKELLHIAANPKYGSEKKGAPTNYFLVAAPERVRVNCDLRHVDVVLCCDPKAFTHTNPLLGLREGGAIIWENGESEQDKAWGRLPLWARKEIVEKKINVYILNGFDIAKNATSRKDLQLRMQGNSFLGAFFKVSPFLDLYKIPFEEYQETVLAQYNKKFGKFGEAVVESNMTVMNEGFNKVTALTYGDIDAPDTSSMRGDVLSPCSTGDNYVDTKKEEESNIPIFTKEIFDKEFREIAGYNQPASALAASGIMAAATGADNSKFVARRLVPRYIPENCTQCMDCITACPDTALPNTAQEISTVLTTMVGNYVSNIDNRKALIKMVPEFETAIRAEMKNEVSKKSEATPFDKLAITSIREVVTTANGTLSSLDNIDKSIGEIEAIIHKFPVAYSSVAMVFGSKEKKEPGTGGIFSILVSDLCKGCAQCVTECGNKNALEMVEETESVNASLFTGIEFLNLLPDTPKQYLGLYDPANPLEARAAVLQNHLLQRSKYEAIVSGDGACAGCGEKTIMRTIATLTEALMRPIFHTKADRLNQIAEDLRSTGKARLDKLEADNPDQYKIMTRTLLHTIMGFGGENLKETEKLISENFKGGNQEIVDALVMVLVQDAFNHKKLRTIEGRHNGMNVMGMTANTGCNTVFGSTPPSNPHPYPWMNSLFQDGTTIGWLMAENFIVNHINRSVIPERLATCILADFDYAPFELTEESYFLYTHMSEVNLDELEIMEMPKVWNVGGDGGIGDIGYQNLSKAILQNKPNYNVVMLDTQVYSNTGGQNSDSSVMPGGFDMNQFGMASSGKLTEKKGVALSMTSGHGSPFVAQVSMANPANLYKAVLDGLSYRGAAYFQCFTTCQPEHGVGDSESTVQAQSIRDSRGMPEFVFDPKQGESYQECFNVKGNPAGTNDWYTKTTKATKERYIYTAIHWAATEARFRRHFKKASVDEIENGGINLDDILWRITQQDTVNRRIFDKNHRSFIPLFGVYSNIEQPDGSLKPAFLSRQLVLFCVERRKNWRLLQSRAGVTNKDYVVQKELLKRYDNGEIEKDTFFNSIQDLIKEIKADVLS